MDCGDTAGRSAAAHVPFVFSWTVTGPVCGFLSFGAGLWLASEQGGEAMTCGIYGIAVLLVFRLAQVAGERQPLLLPVFALFIPLLCLLLL